MDIQHGVVLYNYINNNTRTVSTYASLVDQPEQQRRVDTRRPHRGKQLVNYPGFLEDGERVRPEGVLRLPRVVVVRVRLAIARRS